MIAQLAVLLLFGLSTVTALWCQECRGSVEECDDAKVVHCYYTATTCSTGIRNWPEKDVMFKVDVCTVWINEFLGVFRAALFWLGCDNFGTVKTFLDGNIKCEHNETTTNCYCKGKM